MLHSFLGLEGLKCSPGRAKRTLNSKIILCTDKTTFPHKIFCAAKFTLYKKSPFSMNFERIEVKQGSFDSKLNNAFIQSHITFNKQLSTKL